MYSIYKFENKITGEKYIGYTQNIKSRKSGQKPKTTNNAKNYQK